MPFELTKGDLRHVHLRRDRPAAARVDVVPNPDPDSIAASDIVDTWWATSPAHAVECHFAPDGLHDNHSGTKRLRARIATAPKDEHDDALATLEAAFRDGRADAKRRIAMAYVAPHRREWFVHSTASASARGSLWFLTMSDLDDLDVFAGQWAPFRDARISAKALTMTWADSFGEDFDELIIRLLESSTYLGRRIGGAIRDAAVRLQTDRAYAATIGDGLGPYEVSAGMRDALKKGMKLAPALAAKHFVPEFCRDDPWGMAQRPALIDFVVDNPDIVAAAKAAWRPEVVDFIEAIEAAEAGSGSDEAVVAGLPEVLVSPPWENRQKIKRVSLTLEPLHIEPYMAWLDGERPEVPSWGRSLDPSVKLEDWDSLSDRDRHDLLFADNSPHDVEALRPFAARVTTAVSARHIARFEVTMHDALLRRVRQITQAWEFKKWKLALPMGSTELAELAIEVSGRRIAVSPHADEWLKRHAGTAATVLIPRVLSKERKGRAANESALWFVGGHDRGAVLQAAASYGDDAAVAIKAFLDIDPLQMLPSRLPALPTWFSVGEMRRPTLAATREELPQSALQHIVMMLALSKEAPYAGLDLVREACDADSLAAFALDLHQQWHERGRERKTVWACAALDHFGNDSLIEELDSVFDVDHGLHDAVVRRCLDAFERIATDAAMRAMYLRAQRITRKVTKRDARRALAAMAESRGLTMEQLGDITIPRFDLDDAKTVELDFGPRHFVLTFDEELQPVVRAESGALRATLPKANAADDAVLAAAAHKRFAKLKREVKKTATEQRKRFEAAMVSGRRWTVDEFIGNFVDHPLMVEMVRRLVWGLWHSDDPQALTPVATFRRAEDGTWADATDSTLTLPDDGAFVVGIAHPVEMLDQLERWATTFHDYEIGQPFEQLKRTYSVSVDDTRWRQSGYSLAPVKAVTAPYQRVLGMASRGWTDEQIGAQTGFFRRELRDGRGDLNVSPPFTLGTPFQDPTVEGISLGVPPEEAHPVSVSEAIRELEWLTRP